MLCSVQSPGAIEHASRAMVMDARVRGRDEPRAEHPERPALVSPPWWAAVRDLTSPAMAATPPEDVRRRYARVPEVQGPASAHRDGRRAPHPGTPRLSGRRSAAGPGTRSDYAPTARSPTPRSERALPTAGSSGSVRRLDVVNGPTLPLWLKFVLRALRPLRSGRS